MYKVYKDDGIRRVEVARFDTRIEQLAYCMVRSWCIVEAHKIWCLTT